MSFFSALSKFAAKPREADDIARAYARLFETADGKTVLEHLHAYAVFRVNDPNIPDNHLHFLDGQRQLVLFICQMTAKGKQP